MILLFYFRDEKTGVDVWFLVWWVREIGRCFLVWFGVFCIGFDIFEFERVLFIRKFVKRRFWIFFCLILIRSCWGFGVFLF